MTTAMNIITAICQTPFTSEVIYITAKIIVKKRTKNIVFIQSLKQGY